MVFCSHQSLTVYNIDIKTHSNKEFCILFKFLDNFLTILGKWSAGRPPGNSITNYHIDFVEERCRFTETHKCHPFIALEELWTLIQKICLQRLDFYTYFMLFLWDFYIFQRTPHLMATINFYFFFIGMIMDIVFSKGNRSVRFRINLTTISLLGNI